MGIAAIIMGAIALLISVLPLMSAAMIFISWLAWLFVLLGLIFGIIALAKGKKKPGLIGVALSVLAIVMYFVAANVVANQVMDALDSELPGLQDALNAELQKAATEAQNK